MIWLIGNKGMLGSDVEKLLKTQRYDFTATDIEVDITDYNAVGSFIDSRSIEWVINCAAYTAVDKAEDEKELAFKINATGPENLARVCKEIGAKLIHISTDYVFDGQKDGAYTEEDRPNPLNVYGKSKLAGEQAVRSILSIYYIIRTSWLYGKNGSNFISTMLRLFRDKEEVKVVSDQWGTPTYTKDLAEVILRILDLDNNMFGVYHFSNECNNKDVRLGKDNLIETDSDKKQDDDSVNGSSFYTHQNKSTQRGITWYDFAKEIYRISIKCGLIDREVKITPIKTEEYQTKARRPRNSLLSKEKIKKAFGLNIRPWQDALKDFITNELKS